MNISNNNGLNLSFNGYVSPSTNKLIRQAALSELRVLVNDANNKGVAVDVSMLNNIKNRTSAIISALNNFAAKLHQNTQMGIIPKLPPQKMSGNVNLLFDNTNYRTIRAIPVKDCDNKFALNRLGIYEHIANQLENINPQEVDEKILNNVINDIKNTTKGLRIPLDYNKKVEFAKKYAKEIGVNIDIPHASNYKGMNLKQKQDCINNNNNLLMSVFSEICKITKQ